MKRKLSILIAFLFMGDAILAGSFPQQSAATQRQIDANVPRIKAVEGELVKLTIEAPDRSTVLKVVNDAFSPADVDLSVFDRSDNEIARETVVIDPSNTAKLKLKKLFPDLVF